MRQRSRITNAPIGVYNEDWGQYSRRAHPRRFEEASAFSTIACYFKSEREIQPTINSQSVLADYPHPQDFSRKVAARER